MDYSALILKHDGNWWKPVETNGKPVETGEIDGKPVETTEKPVETDENQVSPVETSSNQ